MATLQLGHRGMRGRSQRERGRRADRAVLFGVAVEPEREADLAGLVRVLGRSWEMVIAQNFDTVLWAMLSLFEIATTEVGST